ncbi:MAG: sulfite exporter TauE/SafE family protein [Pseudomonadota bacterium]
MNIEIAVAALLAGLMGSVHCIGMCGGLSGVFATHVAAQSTRQSLLRGLAYNTGRLLSYGLLGAAVAGLGAGFVSEIPALATPLRIIAGVLVILMGLQIAFGIQWLKPVERLGGRVWSLIAPLAGQLLPPDTAGKSLGLGLLWGLLPCGLVYSMLAVAFAGGDPLNGATALLAFGIGTTPAMLLTGFSAYRLSAYIRNKRVAAGGLLVAIGMLTLGMPAWHALSPTDHQQHAHHEHHYG